MFTVEDRRARVGLRHHLAPSQRTDEVADITESLVALHSSDPATVYLTAMARMNTPSSSAISDALYVHRSVLRQHAMRRTIWVSTVDTMRAAHAACTMAYGEKEWARLGTVVESSGISDDGVGWLNAASERVLAALADGPLTTRTIGAQVPGVKASLVVPAGKQTVTTQGAHTRMMLHLGFLGRVLRGRTTGAWNNAEYQWHRAEDWVAGGLGDVDPVDGAAALAHRYLLGFGPATTVDLQWWAGWSKGTTVKALTAAGAVPVDMEGGTGWVAAGDEDRGEPAEPWVAVLPGLDATTMGWKQRDWYIAADDVALLFDRDGNAGPTIWVDGRVVGGWAQAKSGEIRYRLLTDVGRERSEEIAAEVGRWETVLGEMRITARFPARIQPELLA